MIKKINNIHEIDNFKNNDLYSIRIMSLIKAYGCGYDFARFYAQFDIKGNITAIISYLDGDYTLSLSDGADNNELSQFFSMSGLLSLLSDDSFVMDRPYDSGVVMCADKRVEFDVKGAHLQRFPKLMELFNFIDYDKTDFESWYVDISHRIRHGCAAAYTLEANGETVSSGIFTSIYNNNAILSAVKTSEQSRRKGYGLALVSEMMADIPGKVYLMREKEINESFYKRLGFDNIGVWRMYK